MTQILQIVEEIKKHAWVFWAYDTEAVDSIELTKVDTAVDLLGAFIPDDGRLFNHIKGLLREEIPRIFAKADTNFLSLSVISDLKVHRGSNKILDTCY